LEQTRAVHDGKELLFVLELAALKAPQLLERGQVSLREPTDSDAEEFLVAWRADYQVERLGAVRSPELEASARQQIAGWRERRQLWVLVDDARVVAMTGFNAATRGIVQIGGVSTPPALRGKGYARAAVAASLQLARENGARRSVLFTSEHNQPARRAYASLGYQVSGNFGLVLF
jgi:uncharacterized protein